MYQKQESMNNVLKKNVLGYVLLNMWVFQICGKELPFFFRIEHMNLAITMIKAKGASV